MIADLQLAQLNNPGMQPCSATTMEHACARCQDQTSALRRLRNMQVSRSWWSVNCCVQACKQTQRDTQGRKRVKCAHVGDTNNTPPRANRESGVIQKLPTELAFGKSGKLEKTLEILLTFQGLAKPQIRSFPSIRAVSEHAILILARKNVDFKLTRDDTSNQLSRARFIQTSLLALSRSFIRIGYRQSFCAEESRITVESQQLDRIMSVLKFCHMEQISAWSI